MGLTKQKTFNLRPLKLQTPLLSQGGSVCVVQLCAQHGSCWEQLGGGVGTGQSSRQILQGPCQLARDS